MSSPLIDRLYEDNKLIRDRLLSSNEISLATAIDDIFRKTLLLAAASYFEYMISTAILEYVEEKANADIAVLTLIKIKAIDRQYHTYFDWNSSNVNTFFGHFGDKYKQYAKERIEKEPALKESVRAFLEIGSLRNQLVHQNFATFVLDKTADEIYESYKRALRFIAFVPESLRNVSLK